jgi:hypothetical protein
MMKALVSIERQTAKLKDLMKLHMGAQGQAYLQEEEAENKKKRKRKKKEDIPGKPKRPLTAYMMYLQAMRGNKEANKDMKSTEIVKHYAALWGKMDDQAKTIYTQQAANAKAEYQLKKEDFDSKQVQKVVHPVPLHASSTMQPTSHTGSFQTVGNQQLLTQPHGMAGHYSMQQNMPQQMIQQHVLPISDFIQSSHPHTHPVQPTILQPTAEPSAKKHKKNKKTKKKKKKKKQRKQSSGSDSSDSDLASGSDSSD